MNYTQIYTQMVRPKININYIRRNRVQRIAKELNNGMEMALGVCLLVCEWVTGWFACCLYK